MFDELGLHPLELSESRAVVELVGIDVDSLATLSGEIVGPKCAYARTLPATHSIRVIRKDSDAPPRVEATITEPCYWTPALPFQYDLNLRWQDAKKTLRTYQTLIGVKRFAPGPAARKLRSRGAGQAFELESERFVLRGARAASVSLKQISAARVAETTLVAPWPDEATCTQASLDGVPLLADLRDGLADVRSAILALSQRPAVAMAVLNPEVIDAVAEEVKARRLWIAQGVGAASSVEKLHRDADVVIVELQPGERPPAWAAECGRPVIAVRRGTTYADLHEARAACDRLQAELAPEFDLAGYFV